MSHRHINRRFHEFHAMASFRAKNIASFFLPSISIVFVILSITMIRCSAWNADNCSNFCQCYWRYGLKWADCKNHRLHSVQTGIDEAVQALDLYNNSISSLANYELRDSGLTRLKLLNLSYNAVSEIGLMAFVDLSQLKVLDLSKNHLYSILPDVFVGNKRLEVLVLAGNNLNHHVPTLQSSSLGSLDLSDCGISYLPSNTFSGLPRLRALDLTDNMMIQLELNMMKELPNLAILLIGRNPWSCNSDMHELQNLLARRKIIFERVCNEASESKNVPKKFAKMMAAEHPVRSNVESTSGRLLVEMKNWKNSTKIDSVSHRCRSHVTSKVIVRDNEFAAGLATFSPYLFLALGFVLGSAISTVITYFWLSRSFSRSAFNYRRRGTIGTESSEIVSQRVNLMHYLWQGNEETSHSTTDCPGTPPPPYRDVILYSSRYPRPNQNTLVFDNETDDQ